ncbi:unnamed protein product [Brassicogethes aeneus]|uniref:Peptidase metallopeptidase domain-containing protein n=1 Tax=Brassicogethes aeneus TaxID=1431903 RepID=A0A9P0B5Q9_BRAAE|nr:unnamed protein product [Brassicogethes aeneus]
MKRLLTFLLLVFVLKLSLVDGAPPMKKRASLESLEFMKKYGYLNSDSESASLYTDKGLDKALKLVQKYGNIPETGLLDNATIKLMSAPRCGLPDIVRDGNRQKRFVLASKGWDKRHLTYSVSNWSPRLGEGTVIRNIQKALDIWGQYGHLKFTRVGGPDADIIVKFGRGYHDDMFPFDGEGSVLAHAFFPNSGIGGDIHFDDDEKWADLTNGEGNANQDGTDFFSVALHELGHSLGLQHSPVASSVMFAYYKGFDNSSSNFLDYDDILGMYELYIRRPINDVDPYQNRDTSEVTTRRAYYPNEKTTRKTYYTERHRPQTTTRYYTPPTTRKTTTRVTTPYTHPTRRNHHHTTPKHPRKEGNSVNYEGDVEDVDDHLKHDSKLHFPATKSPVLNICDGKFDSVASLRGEFFIFKGNHIWRLKRMGYVEPGYPVTLRDMFPTLPKYIQKIDAAYQRPDGMMVLFTDNMYWVHDGGKFIENSPRPISDYGLPNSLDKIDAVFNWIRNDKTYLYKNDRFWRYNESTRALDKGYPLSMERWRGVPSHLDAVTSWNGETYFFKDRSFWKVDTETINITGDSPLNIGHILYECRR